MEAPGLRSPLECFRFSSVNGLSHMASVSTMRSMGENKRTGGRLIIHKRSCPPLILAPGGQICWESDRHPMILKARLISTHFASTRPLKTQRLLIHHKLPGLISYAKGAS